MSKDKPTCVPSSDPVTVLGSTAMCAVGPSATVASGGVATSVFNGAGTVVACNEVYKAATDPCANAHRDYNNTSVGRREAADPYYSNMPKHDVVSAVKYSA
ncbi:MAG: hypothetical protein H6909_00900 [Rickettsiaceae bacterium]|nr:hypothetical protein [Rickettsiaceae bacterium]